MEVVMKRLGTLLGMALICCMIFAGTTHAEEKPVQLALVAPVQLFPENTDIVGIRFNLLYGRNASVSGLDLGLVNHTTTGVSKGLQFGLVGLNDGEFVGWQDNFVNSTRGRMEGLQWGFVNYAGHCSGLQLGFVNYAQTMHGLQIGLVNVIRSGGQFPVFPIVNWSF
jgi:hypothetical protein